MKLLLSPGARNYSSACQSLLSFFCASLILTVTSPSSVQAIDFNQDIRPLLSNNCFACHGPDAETREADLRLDIRKDAIKDNDGIQAIVPGNAKESEIILRIFSDDPDSVMPPPDSQKKLSALEKETLKKWVESGAPYQEHWSFQPIASHEVPHVTSSIHNSDLSDIDRFLLRKLRSKDLDLSPTADPTTLIRRLSFDLLGLPARSEWVEKYSSNPTQETYSKIVDEMIASPHFGERMAVFWLDLVRYADTIGYHSDTHREVSGYRDYVINSFNFNKRYDQFTIEQLAGDLLDQSNPWNRIASGYNRLLQTTEEGGAQAKEYRAIYAADRVRNVSGVWLGTTMGCAQCHDHKYDPFTMKDFYSLAAFFDDIKEPAVGKQQPNFKVPDPSLQNQIHSLDQELEHLRSIAIQDQNLGLMQFHSLASIPKETKVVNIGDSEIKNKLSKALGIHSFGNPEVIALDEGQYQRGFSDLVTTAVEIKSELNIKQTPKEFFFIVRIINGDNSKLSISLGEKEVLSNFDHDKFSPNGHPMVISLRPFVDTKLSRKLRFNLSGDGRVMLCAIGEWDGLDKSIALSKKDGIKLVEEFEGSDPFVQLIKPLKVTSSGGAILEDLGDGSFLSKGENPAKDTYSVVIPLNEETQIHGLYLEALRHESLASKSLSRANGNFVLSGVEVYAVRKGKRTPVKLAKPSASFEQGGWPIAGTIDNNPKTGWAVEGWQKFADRQALFPFTQNVTAVDGSQLEVLLKHESDHAQHNIGRFRLSVLTKPIKKLEGLKLLPQEFAGAIAKIGSDNSKLQLNSLLTLVNYARQNSSLFKDYRMAVSGLEKRIKALTSNLRSMLVVERVEPRMTRVLARGNWLDETGEVVSPAIPAFLPKGKAFAAGDSAAAARPNRLHLAQWITDDQNPLTARAFANRMWKLFYGHGLSRNLDDIGGQGEPPTHPELLDYLANQFKDGGWNIKKFVRELVMAKAYQQSSKPTHWLAENDPGNRLFARQSRFRIDAEFVRDTALSVSGLLVDSVGGGNAKPYQPAGYWQHLNFPKRKYQADSGEGLYRRGIYTFWCRTFLHPAMLAFDAPSREECTAERARSNTPQQALVLLNDVQFVEAANALANQSLVDLVNHKQTADKLPLALIDGAKTESASGAFHADSYSQMSFPTNLITRVFHRATSRFPDELELSVLSELYENEQKRFRENFEDAKALLMTGNSKINFNEENAGEKAALASVARTVINLYETMARY